MVCLTLAAAGFSPTAVTAAADAGLGVTNPMAMYDVTAGQSVTHSMTVGLGSAADPSGLDVVVETRGLGQGVDGAFDALPAEADASPLSARSFVQSVSPATFHLEPGQSQVVNAILSVPRNVGSGTRYADLYVRGQPAGVDAMVQTRAAIHVPVVLAIDSTEQIDAGTIELLDLQRSPEGPGLQLVAIARNTGDHHFAPRLVTTLFDESGNVLERHSVEPTLPSILPTFARRMSATFATQFSSATACMRNWSLRVAASWRRRTFGSSAPKNLA